MTTLQIVITEKCNLNCSYCYMNNRNTFLTREAFMKFYESLSFDQKYKLDFFGGEPLLNWDMIKFITETTRNDSKFKSLSIYSNGLLLTQEIVDYIKTNDINFFWSCDGVTEKHIEYYINKSNLINQLCDSVSTVITPDTLFFIENYVFFMNHFKITPDFKLVKSGWSVKSINEFKILYEKYIDFLILEFKQKRIKIPDNIIHNMKILYEGIKKNEPKKRCIDSNNICLMPDGSIGFCAMKCTNGDNSLPEKYDELYNKCIDCEITNFCDKGCYEIVRQNGGVDDNMCELTKFILNQSIKINNQLKNDSVWVTRYIRPIFNNYKG